MTTSIESVTCTDCGHEFAGPLGEIPATPCLACGSERKSVVFTGVADKLSPPPHDRARGRWDRLARGRWGKEFISQTEFHRETQSWRHVERVIDRVNDTYFERITDLETRDTVKRVEEPLSEHQGHGSARRRPFVPPAGAKTLNRRYEVRLGAARIEVVACGQDV